MWGAALHDQATGVHRPLAHLLWLQRPGLAQSVGVADMNRLIADLLAGPCILDSRGTDDTPEVAQAVGWFPN